VNPADAPWAYVRDVRTGHEYGGGPLHAGVPRTGEHVKTRDHARTGTPAQWVRVKQVAWELGREHVTLWVLPSAEPGARGPVEAT
jgi:hypothetical protein